MKPDFSSFHPISEDDFKHYNFALILIYQVEEDGIASDDIRPTLISRIWDAKYYATPVEVTEDGYRKHHILFRELKTDVMYRQYVGTYFSQPSNTPEE